MLRIFALTKHNVRLLDLLSSSIVVDQNIIFLPLKKGSCTRSSAKIQPTDLIMIIVDHIDAVEYKYVIECDCWCDRWWYRLYVKYRCVIIIIIIMCVTLSVTTRTQFMTKRRQLFIIPYINWFPIGMTLQQ